ncbi:MAG: hypothetical protein A3C88_01180 [Candidatus Yanofskybacteria bacterium RIFCSPHIGHO2_02_FULL_50_12]|uniref:Tyrosine specific protein phosphatases domain-containing protein n=1 Tax=Candidatus Yanofskybacteria bacterium RIFCSPHIGHO2_02_FULL_50_12 TaxID=1802685 RepID=A0A1F8FUY5_9BACT|nr:MAG: hypothetical protein A3C88_01180 [Candidatus Yanofskybacteria bacterium RIFCSPHIGHO2_02_FULL_50_12]
MKCQDHQGQVVEVGGLTVHLGGVLYHPLMDLSIYNLVVPFLEDGHPKLAKVREAMGSSGVLLHYPIPDYCAPPSNWREFLDFMVAQLRGNQKVIAFCAGGHGRTGTFLASLIARLEPEIEDPVEEARNRYCEKAVETKEQAAAVFALKGQPLPAKYNDLH